MPPWWVGGTASPPAKAGEQETLAGRWAWSIQDASTTPGGRGAKLDSVHQEGSCSTCGRTEDTSELRRLYEESERANRRLASQLHVALVRLEEVLARQDREAAVVAEPIKQITAHDPLPVRLQLAERQVDTWRRTDLGPLTLAQCVEEHFGDQPDLLDELRRRRAV